MSLDFFLMYLLYMMNSVIFKRTWCAKVIDNRIYNYVLLSINLILGAEPLGVPGMASRSSSMADMGGLVAKGDGTAAGNPNAAAEGPRLKPRLGRFAVVGGGLVAEPDGVGAVPLLNSAQRGHFRFVFMCPI